MQKRLIDRDDPGRETHAQMTSELHIRISGRELHHWLHKVLPDGETVRVGRAVKEGWEIPWDPKISREHATLQWLNGQLRVICLPDARNPLYYRGKKVREATLGIDDGFQIGDTTFLTSLVVEEGLVLDNTPYDFRPESSAELGRVISPEILRKAAFRNTELQMELLEKLPEKISTAQTDEDLGTALSQLLLDAIQTAVAVAVFNVDESLLSDVAKGDALAKPLTMRVQTRESFQGRFSPSRRMILKCLKTRASVVHVFQDDEASQFTVNEGLDWAFCAPIKGEFSRGWCLYISGRGAPGGGMVVTPEELLGDLRFTQLVAQFIGSIRQVRMLQEKTQQLSTFFSPKIIEGLGANQSTNLLRPAERVITVLFCDVRGFSKKAESLQHDLPALLKSVSAALDVMANGIVERDGAIADFQGDAALGFWGWPIESAEGPIPACRSALDIYRAFRAGVRRQDSLLFGFSIGMGIAHGRALAGQIGSTQQSKIGVFGPVVNQGARLEGLTKQFGLPICIDESTARFAMRFLPSTDGRIFRLARVRPMGMDTPVTVFGLVPPADEFPELTSATISEYELAVEAIIQGDWPRALEILQHMPEHFGPKQFLLHHMHRSGDAPPADWDGAFSVGNK